MGIKPNPEYPNTDLTANHAFKAMFRHAGISLHNCPHVAEFKPVARGTIVVTYMSDAATGLFAKPGKRRWGRTLH